MDGVAQLYLPHLQHSPTTLFTLETGHNLIKDVYVEDYDVYGYDINSEPEF